MVFTYFVFVFSKFSGAPAYASRMVKETLATEARGFAERLRQAMVESGVQPSASVLAHEFNLRYWSRSITVHTARNWLVGASLPMQDKLVILAQWLQISPDELRFGIRHEGPAHSVREAGAFDDALGLQDREMLRRYLSLPIGDRQIVREVVTAFSDAQSVRRGEKPKRPALVSEKDRFRTHTIPQPTADVSAPKPLKQS